ncbi:hypothetical protein HGI30_05460 [Paenibacillus albicereus]|uniref:Uncharacterized protein n=1 Tax=Paenibacillus albicereus TaxID=2726185 RepID=A0A6H2GRV6_9BACL|nr:hypothetical protein [Paenibacillus albicereus]QJC50142.1 hypothetical protein HGI30_05460 [Paenibacillus albicereus]
MLRLDAHEGDEAMRALASVLSKSEKAREKLKRGSSSEAAISREINAYRIALDLIARARQAEPAPDAEAQAEQASAAGHTKAELEDALSALQAVIAKIEKAQPRLKPGTSSHTLTERRQKALRSAVECLNMELER